MEKAEKTVTISESEYRRYLAFRGAENTISNLRTELNMKNRECRNLAMAVSCGLERRCDGRVYLIDEECAGQAISLAETALLS